jgi:four helix bundle protein
MTYDEWLKNVPSELTGDPLWKLEAYRLSLFAADIGWQDICRLIRDRRTVGLSDQLYRALGSMGANVSEGFSRGTGRDRARFYEYALGSGRESRGWYWNARHVLGETVTQHRLGLITQIIRLLLIMVPDQRGFAIHEDSPAYRPALGHVADSFGTDSADLPTLLEVIPMP